MANISSASVAELDRNQNATIEIIKRMCIALKCDVSDIMEVTNE